MSKVSFGVSLREERPDADDDDDYDSETDEEFAESRVVC